MIDSSIRSVHVARRGGSIDDGSAVEVRESHGMAGQRQVPANNTADFNEKTPVDAPGVIDVFFEQGKA